MFPQAVVAPFELVVESLTALALHQAFAFAALVYDDDAELRVDFSLAILVAAGRADLDLGGKNQFFAHIGCK